MTNPTRLMLTLAVALLPAAALAAPLTPAQRCQADIELASAKFAQCRLTAESKFATNLDAGKRATAVARCSDKLERAFSTASIRYGLNCTAEPVTAFDTYLTQCSDDVAAASALGGGLPDYAGDLATCNAGLTSCSTDLTTCDGNLTASIGDLATCTADLGVAQSDLAMCQGDLATCQAATAQLLKTGQTTSYGAGDDGDLQKGVARNYLDNGDGTITDTRTGLMWEKKDLNSTGSVHRMYNVYTWSAGASSNNGTAFTIFLAALNAGSGFAGYTDWRLPNLFELESIVDVGNFNPSVSTAFNTHCDEDCTVTTCSCTMTSDCYWSSSTYEHDSSYAWFVYFYTGGVGVDGKGRVFYARAVRGGS